MTGALDLAPRAEAPDRELWAQVCETARTHAAAVDQEGRYPVEAVAALKASGALGCAVPAALGGAGTGMATLARMACELGAACASTAMVFAMHHNQLACLIRHAGDNAWLRDFTAAVAAQGLLLASVTSEEGIGGRLRTSRCAVEPAGEGRFRLEKQGSTVSYGSEADAFLLTARKDAEADASDQVLVVLPRAEATVEPYRGWNALGLRGTGSGGFRISGTGDRAQVLDVPFGEIAQQTMVPNAHILWGAVWLGIATDVLARCRAFLRTRMRSGSSAAERGLPTLARMHGHLQDMEAALARAITVYDGQRADPGALEAILLKTRLSDTALAVADMGMRLCGFTAYSNEGPYSLSRHLRDLYAAPLMINNDAILADAGRLLLVNRTAFGAFDAEQDLP